MGKVVSIADLLEQKEKRTKVETATVYVESLGGELEIKKLPLATFMDLVAGVSENSSGQEILQAQYELIYSFCPVLHNLELQAAYECKVPSDIVGKVFNDNLDDINAVTTAIAELYGNKSLTQMEEELKN